MHYDGKEFVQVSLKTTSESIAIQRASVLDAEIEKIWGGISASTPFDKITAFENAVNIARSYNFTYKPVIEVADEDIYKIINRIKTIDNSREIDEKAISALLGGIDKPALLLKDLWSDYYSFMKPDLNRKTSEQLRKWKNPRIKAFKNFIDICGDIPVHEISRDHILTFRMWWADRIREETMSPNSPNKDLTHLKSLLSFAQDNKGAQFDVNTLFARTHFKESDSEKKPFKADFIINNLLNHNRLRGLNDECKYFLFAFADTGARPSEIVGLNFDAGDIRLDTDIPYIYIRPDKKKEIKNRFSKRKIPLVGSALYAFKELGGGFERYYRKPDLLSATLNKYLRNNGLLPSEDHSLYSLCHSFEDRLTAVEPPDKVQAALMGHRYDRPRYGGGPSLEQKYEWMKKIAFEVPL